MKTKDANLYGKQFASDILRYGDFSESEKQDQDLFIEAFHEISENKRQYDGFSYFAALVNSKKNSESLWESFESGISEVLDSYLEKMF